MGIWYESICYYGLTFSYEDITSKKIIWPEGWVDYEEDEENALRKQKYKDFDYTSFPLLKFRYTSPYFDCDEKERLFHIGYSADMKTPQELLDIEPELIQQLQTFCKKYKFNYETPTITSYPNVC